MKEYEVFRIGFVSVHTSFSAHHLKTRECCGSSCRHCPWGHRNVPGKKFSQARAVSSSVEPQAPGGGGLPAPKSRLHTRKGDAGYGSLYNEYAILKSDPIYEVSASKSMHQM